MSEELIIEYCSPTLAGIKAGCMFSVKVTEDTDINNEVHCKQCTILFYGDS